MNNNTSVKLILSPNKSPQIPITYFNGLLTNRSGNSIIFNNICHKSQQSPPSQTHSPFLSPRLKHSRSMFVKPHNSSYLEKPIQLLIKSNNNNSIFESVPKKQCSPTLSKQLHQNQYAFGRTLHNNKTNNEHIRSSSNDEVELMKHKSILKPFQIAGTIYKELFQQKEKFYNQIKRSKDFNIIDVKKHTPNIPNDLSGCMTSLLNRKFIKELPVTFPLCLYHNIKYTSISQQRRHEKIIYLFLKLKIHISKEPENHMAIIKEFLQRNNITNPEFYNKSKIQNFFHFLNHPIKFGPNISLYEAILTALNYRPTDEDIAKNMSKCQKNKNNDNKNNEFKVDTIYDITPTIESSCSSKIKLVKQNKKKQVVNVFDNIDNNKYLEKIKNTYFQPKSLRDLIKVLENELSDIQKEKMERIEKSNNNSYNNSFYKNKVELNDLLNDNNVLVPNLCLSNGALNDVLVNRINETKHKILTKLNKQKQLNEINQRMYYDCVLKNSEFNIEDIKRRNKLTEFIILERAKKKLELQEKKKLLNIDKNII